MSSPIPLHCTNPASLSKPHSLGALDTLVLPFCPITVIFVYPCAASAIDVDLLKRSLELTLDTYPHLTGRLKLSGEGYPAVVDLGKGAALYTATRPERLDDLRGPTGRITMPDLPENGSTLLADFDSSLEGVQRQPILMVKHTRFACGGVGLGITVHHLVCDASGFFQFVRDVSTVYASLRAGETSPSLPPAHLIAYTAPEAPDSTLPPSLRLEKQAVADKIADGPDSLESILPTNTPPVLGRVLRFSASELASIKAAATTGDSWVSSHEALTSHIWQRTYIARVKLLANESDAETAFNREVLSSINMRAAGRLGLPERYFPNAIYPPNGKLSHDVLYAQPLSAVAAAVHGLYRTPIPAMVVEYARWIDARQREGNLNLVRSAFNYGPGAYVVTSWTAFNIYRAVGFDGVDPVVVTQPFTSISLLDGLAMMFSTEVDGAVDVNLTLTEPVWSVLDQDAEFRRYQ